MPLPRQHGFAHDRTRLSREHGSVVGTIAALLNLFSGGILQGAGILTPTTILGVP